jgi:hypothetical protein
MNKTLAIFCVSILLISCDFFEPKPPENPIARVNKSYLYQKDIADLISKNTSPEDSASIVSNYITRWATQQLLIDQAQINLSPKKIEAYERLVTDYKNDLFTEAYKATIVGKQMDSTITNAEYESFYAANKHNFKLKEELYKLRFIHVDKEFANFVETKQKLNRFNTKDKEDLVKMRLKFKAANFNDSVWIKKEALLLQLPVLQINQDKFLKKQIFAQIQDSLGVYLLKIEDVLVPGDMAPLTTIKPTIEQILLNKKKLQLVKKLEKDITKDAIKNKNFEIYTLQ